MLSEYLVHCLFRDCKEHCEIEEDEIDLMAPKSSSEIIRITDKNKDWKVSKKGLAGQKSKK